MGDFMSESQPDEVIYVTCPFCKRVNKTRRRFIGQRGRCKCGQSFMIAEIHTSICPHCGQIVRENETVCGLCGRDTRESVQHAQPANATLEDPVLATPAAVTPRVVRAAPATTIVAPDGAEHVYTRAGPFGPNVQVVVQPSRASHSLGIAALVLGIIAFVICWIPFLGLIGLPLSAIGLILGVIGLVLAISRRGSGIGFSIAGCALCGLSLLVAWSVTHAASRAYHPPSHPQ